MSNSTCHLVCYTSTGVSSIGEPRVPWHPHILADPLTLSQPGGAFCAYHITNAPPRIFGTSYATLESIEQGGNQSSDN